MQTNECDVKHEHVDYLIQMYEYQMSTRSHKQIVYKSLAMNFFCINIT